MRFVRPGLVVDRMPVPVTMLRGRARRRDGEGDGQGGEENRKHRAVERGV